MIVSKTPFRMSFVGGGSDMSSFYREDLGAVLSTSIDKYMYVTVNKKFDGGIRVSYSKVEEVESIDLIEHPIVRESLKLAGIHGGIEIASMADIPGRGTGLGSSSSYAVGLLNAINAYKNQYASKKTLAEQACDIEINKCGEPIGKQDQYAASYGGLNLIQFYADERVSVTPLICKPKIIQEIEKSILIFYTGRTRSASSILVDQSERLMTSNTKLVMKKMVQLVFDLKANIESGLIQNFGEILHENWTLKKQLSPGITDTEIDEWYEKGINAGASGGKLLGAGSGGFLMFFAPEDKHQEICRTLSFLRPIKIGFDKVGTQIIYFEN